MIENLGQVTQVTGRPRSILQEKNRFQVQVQVQKTEDERTCNHNNQVCSIMEHRFDPLRGMLFTLKRNKHDSVHIVFVEA